MRDRTWRWLCLGWAAVLVVVAGLLAVGCAPQAETVVSFTPTSLPVPTVAPALVPTSTVTLEPRTIEAAGTVTFTVVYDNDSQDPALQTAWGFACLVETGEATVLFDTGGDSPTLLSNMARLGFDPPAIDAVVLSHSHDDHVGGLMGLLETGARPTVYVPATFPTSFKDGVRARTDLVEITGPAEILPGLYTTGGVDAGLAGAGIVEQALVVETGDGLVVVTGCAHPGIVEMVRRAQEAAGGEVALVMGGSHLEDTGQAQIERIIADLRALGVQRVALSHCTGGLAQEMFAAAFGADFFPAGVGWAITLNAR